MIKLTSKQVLLKLLAEEGYEGLYVLLSRPCRWIMRRKSLENTSLLKVCCFIRIFFYRVFLYNFLPLPVSAVALTSHLTTRTRARGKFLYIVTFLYKIVFLYKNLPPTNLELPEFRAFDGAKLKFRNNGAIFWMKSHTK